MTQYISTNVNLTETKCKNYDKQLTLTVRQRVLE